MELRISNELNHILTYAREEAMRTGSYTVECDHLMLGILRHGSNPACSILTRNGVILDELKNYLESMFFKSRSIPYSDEDKVSIGRSAENALNMTIVEANLASQSEMNSIHLLLGICRCAECYTLRHLSACGTDREKLTESAKTAGLLKADKSHEAARLTMIVSLMGGHPTNKKNLS